jgi:enediyne biosynthesis protein E5
MNALNLQIQPACPALRGKRLRDKLAHTDARVYQILFLATLLSLGVLVRDFSLKPEQMALTFAAGLATQALFIRLLGLRNVGLLSAIITCFGLSILLRADTLWVHPLAAFIAIGAGS